MSNFYEYIKGFETQAGGASDAISELINLAEDRVLTNCNRYGDWYEAAITVPARWFQIRRNLTSWWAHYLGDRPSTEMGFFNMVQLSDHCELMEKLRDDHHKTKGEITAPTCRIEYLDRPVVEFTSEGYWFDLSRVSTKDELCNWLAHLSSKDWFGGQEAGDFIMLLKSEGELRSIAYGDRSGVQGL